MPSSSSTPHYLVDFGLSAAAAPTPADVDAQHTFLDQLARDGRLLLSGVFADTLLAGKAARGVSIVKGESIEQVTALFLLSPLVERGFADFTVRSFDITYGIIPK
jgi:uncharacterized protein YciI